MLRRRQTGGRLGAAACAGFALVGVLAAGAGAESAPRQPANLAVTASSPGGVTLTWSVPAGGAAAYEVETDDARTTTQQPTLRLSRLACGRRYRVELRALDAKGRRSEQVAISVTGPCDRTPPSRPQSLTVTAQTQTSLALVWAPSSDDVGVVAYDLRRSGPDDDDDDATVTAPAFTFAGLRCGRHYTLLVLARDAAGNRSAPATVSASTSACAPRPPQAPAVLLATAAGPTSVALVWLPVPGAAGYLVSVGAAAPVAVATPWYLATGLTCGTTYTFAVAARSDAGGVSTPTTRQAATGACAAQTGGANLWLDDNGGTCTRAPAAVAYADLLACGSFQAALNAAAPGDLVHVRCRTTSCTYPPELLTGDRGAAAVTFAAAPGSSVSFEEAAGSGNAVYLSNLHHVTFRDIGFGRSNSGDATPNLRIDCSRDLLLVNASGRRFGMFEGNANITFRGGDWGGYGGPGEEDSTMGTTGMLGPLLTCPGATAPQPQRNILFDGVTWHDVFWNVACPGTGTCAAWGGAHPDCFEINGYVDGVTVQNSTFYHCGNTMLSLYTDQGNIDNVVVRGNVFRDMAPTSYWGIQWTDTSAFTCSGDKFLNNTYTPNAPTAWLANTPPRFDCNGRPGGVPTEVAGNTFQVGPPPADCLRSKTQDASSSPPRVYNTSWHDNTFLSGTACVS